MDSIKHNDPFKQFVKSKLDNYKADTPPFGWEKLENSLFTAQKTKTLHRKWLVSSVAAVAAIFIGLLFVIQNTDKEFPMQISENSINQTLSIIKNQDALPIAKEGIIDKTSTSSLIAENASSIKQEITYLKTSNISIKEKEISKNHSSDEKDIPTTTTVKDDQTKNIIKPNDNISEETKQRLIQEFIDEGNRELPSVNKNENKRNKRNSISLTGQSGLLASQNTNTLPSTLRTSLSDTYGSYTIDKMKAFNDIEKIEQESETHHVQPISFGVLTSFDVTPKLYFETGIIYTYLSSETTSKSEDFKNSEKAQFHYLGVPLNLNYTILNLNKLDLFVTAGGMIEKDIYGRIKYSDEKKLQTIDGGYATSNSMKIKQRNPQVSVTAGMGITYPIYDKVNLFGKVGGRYYLDAKNEYETYYSNERFGLDLQFGLKINF